MINIFPINTKFLKCVCIDYFIKSNGVNSKILIFNLPLNALELHNNNIFKSIGKF